MAGDRLVRILCFLVADRDCLDAASKGGGIGEQLRVAAPVHGTKEECRLIDSRARRQQSVILQDECLLVAERLGNVSALFGLEDDTAKAAVDGVILVEETRVLRRNVELDAEGRKRLAVNTVGVHGGSDIRSCLMNCRVDGKCSGIDGSHVAALNSFTLVVDEDEIGDVDGGEVLGERVQPKVVFQDGITHRDVSGRAFLAIPCHNRQ